MLKAGRTATWAHGAASSHTGALAGNDKIYDDVLRQSGVIRALGLNDMLEFARGLPVLPTPKGENVVIITGAGGSGVLLSDACVDNGLTLMEIPVGPGRGVQAVHPAVRCVRQPGRHHRGRAAADLREHDPLGLADERIHALILGYWHTIVTPPMVFAKLCRAGGRGGRAQGDRQAGGRLAGRGTWRSRRPAGTCSTTAWWPTRTRPRSRWRCSGAKYRWARAAGLL